MLANAPARAELSIARLSVMISDSPDSFLLGLKLSNISIKALLDSGATHCFIDSSLVSDHRLPTTLLPQPMRLRLFDGSYAPEDIQYEVTVPVHFAPGKILPVSFLVTPLDPDVSAVIGLRWLRQHNPLVDWANNRIEFRTTDNSVPSFPSTISNDQMQFDLASASPTPSATSALPSASQAPPVSSTIPATPAPSAIPASPATPAPSTPEATLRTAQAVSIRFVNTAAFRMLSKMGSTQTGILHLRPSPSDSSDTSLRGA